MTWEQDPTIDYFTGCTFKEFNHSPHFVYQPCQSLSQGVYHFTGQTNWLLIRSWFKDNTAIIRCFTVLCQFVPPSSCFEHDQTDAHKKKIACTINKIACYQKLKEKQTNCCPCNLQIAHKDLYICHTLLILHHPWGLHLQCKLLQKSSRPSIPSSIALAQSNQVFSEHQWWWLYLYCILQGPHL